MNPISVPVTTKQRPRTTVLVSSETCPPPKTPHEALYFFLAECTTSMILSTTEGSDNCASVSSVYSGLCTIDASPPHAPQDRQAIKNVVAYRGRVAQLVFLTRQDLPQNAAHDLPRPRLG